MRSSARCASDGSPAAAVRSGDCSTVTASALKKSLHATEQERPDVARARRRWMREQGMFDPARLVFIDETSTSTNMVRLRGRCRRGERLIGRVPQGHWKTITFVAGLRHDKMTAPFVVDGPITRAAFLAYIDHVWRQHSGAATSSSSITSRPIEVSPCRRPSKLPVPSCFTCQNIHRILIRSSRPSANSKPIYAKQPSEPFHVFTAGSAS